MTSQPCASCAILRLARTNAGMLAQLFTLTAHEAMLLAVMLVHPIARKTALMDALYFDDPGGGAEPKVIDVHVCKMRPKLRRHGIVIETVWGQGYSLRADARAKIKAMLGQAS